MMRLVVGQSRSVSLGDVVLFVRLSDLVSLCEELGELAIPEAKRLRSAAKSFEEMLKTVEGRIKCDTETKC